MSQHRCKFCKGPLSTTFKCLICGKLAIDLIRQFSMDIEFVMDIIDSSELNNNIIMESTQ